MILPLSDGSFYGYLTAGRMEKASYGFALYKIHDVNLNAETFSSAVSFCLSYFSGSAPISSWRTPPPTISL